MSYTIKDASINIHSTMSDEIRHNYYDDYKRKLLDNDFNEAVEILKNIDEPSQNISYSFTANVMTKLEEKLKKLCMFLLNEYVADNDEYYSLAEPTEEEMNGKIYWIKPY